jgi:Transposase DNA-binding
MRWVANEVAGCRLKEQRLTQRVAVIVERLAAKPTASIPAACHGWGETQATYRFPSASNSRGLCSERSVLHLQIGIPATEGGG